MEIGVLGFGGGVKAICGIPDSGRGAAKARPFWQA